MNAVEIREHYRFGGSLRRLLDHRVEANVGVVHGVACRGKRFSGDDELAEDRLWSRASPALQLCCWRFLWPRRLGIVVGTLPAGLV